MKPLQPQPEIILDERKEPAFSIPGSFALRNQRLVVIRQIPSWSRIWALNLGVLHFRIDEDLDLDFVGLGS